MNRKIMLCLPQQGTQLLMAQKEMAIYKLLVLMICKLHPAQQVMLKTFANSMIYMRLKNHVPNRSLV